MDPYYYKQTEIAYEIIDRYLPAHKENPCKNCTICCTCDLRPGGATLLELHYIKEYISRKGMAAEDSEKFQEYINKERKTYKRCPFYSMEENGCTIYPARALACRTFGYFIKEDSLHLIPDECMYKKNITTYSSETFNTVMPFVRPFYTLAMEYEKMVSRQLSDIS